MKGVVDDSGDSCEMNKLPEKMFLAINSPA